MTSIKKYKYQTEETIKRIPGAREKMSFIFIALFTAIILFSCSQTSTETTDARDSITDFDEDLAIPSFIISTIDDSTAFSSSSLSKDGIILLKYFSPDCNHCQDEATEYLSKKDSLQKIRTIWVTGTWAAMDSIRKFTDTYKLKQINPIAIGKEANNYLISYYNFEGIPYNAVYKDNQLIKEYQGSLDFNELISINNGTFIPEKIVPSWLNEPDTTKEVVENQTNDE